jgi:hypothetical protein
LPQTVSDEVQLDGVAHLFLEYQAFVNYADREDPTPACIVMPGVVFRWLFILLTRLILHGIATQPHANIVIRRAAQTLFVVVAVMNGYYFEHRI